MAHHQKNQQNNQQQKKQQRPKQPQDAYAQQGKQLTSGVQRLRGWVGSDPSRTPELADALVALTEHRLLGHTYTVAAPEAQESVKLAAQLLTANGPIGPYTAVGDAARYVTAVVHLGMIQSAAGLSEAAAETVGSLHELREQLGSLPLVEALAPATRIWALSCTGRGALAGGDLAQANAYADAAGQRLAESGLRSQPEAAYVVVDTDRLISDARWAAGSADEALTHVHLAREAYDRVVDGRLSQPGRLAPALLQRLSEPLYGLYRDLADRLLRVGEVDLGLVTRRQLIEVLRGLAARDEIARVQLAGSLADLVRDLRESGRNEEADLVAEELESVPAPDRTAAAELAGGIPRGDGSVRWQPLDAFAAYVGAETSTAATAATAAELEAELQRQAVARLAVEREEARRVEQERQQEAQVAAERREVERREAARVAAERSAAATAEAERLEADRLAAERAESERIAAEAEAERQERRRRREERIEAHRLGQERLEAERVEGERLAMEQREAERRAADPAEIERLELERLQAEIAELERVEAERVEAERAEAERAEAERADAVRVEAERAEERARFEAEEAARIEAERLAEEQRARERAATERAKAEAWAAQRLEEERLEAERAEAARVESERIAAERAEAARAEAAQAEAERVEAERVEAERVEAERVEAERVEAERAEQERAEAERLEQERVAELERQPADVGSGSETDGEPSTSPEISADGPRHVEPASSQVEEPAPVHDQLVEPAPQQPQSVEPAPVEDELADTHRAWQEARARGDRKTARTLNERVVELLRPRAEADLGEYGPRLLYALEELSSARLRSGELFASRGAAREAKALAKALGRR